MGAPIRSDPALRRCARSSRRRTRAGADRRVRRPALRGRGVRRRLAQAGVAVTVTRYRGDAPRIPADADVHARRGGRARRALKAGSRAGATAVPRRQIVPDASFRRSGDRGARAPPVALLLGRRDRRRGDGRGARHARGRGRAHGASPSRSRSSRRARSSTGGRGRRWTRHVDRLAGFEAILAGPFGDPSVPDAPSLWGTILALRHRFDQYVNLRPVRLLPGSRARWCAPGTEASTSSSCVRTPRGSTPARSAAAPRARVRGGARDVGLHAKRR